MGHPDGALRLLNMIRYPCPLPTLHIVEIHKLKRRVAINRVGYVYIMNNKPFIGFFFNKIKILEFFTELFRVSRYLIRVIHELN